MVLMVTGYMAYLGASSSWQYYVTVDECLAGGPHLTGKRILVSGKVAGGSLRGATDERQASFSLQGTGGSLAVMCSGTLLPDNLAEDRDVVAEGYLQADATLRAEKILTRCASKYKARQSAASPDNRANERGD
jgi:cytochrome c-type biogenesis protein CcmE